MTKKFDFDLIIIGSGPAGTASALTAKSAGLSVAITENRLWGGSGLNSRDLPFCSATSLSNLYFDAVSGSRFGISSKSLRYNYPIFKKWLSLSKKRSGANSKSFFEKSGITCLKGIAHFLSPYEISVGEKVFSAKNFVIASGAVPDSGGIVGIEGVKCLTPETVFDQKSLPKSVTIIGGGSTGCEFATFFASLGTKVEIIEASDRLLPKEDLEAGKVLERHFEETFKSKVLLSSKVVSVSSLNSEKKLTIVSKGKEKTLKPEEIFLATGSKPALDLGLENAGVRYRSEGIFVNRFFQTSMKHIYAVGDCLGGESSSELATAEGTIATENLLKKAKFTLDESLFPRVVKANPEIVFLGLSEEKIIKLRKNYKKVFVPLSEASVSNTSDSRIGFLKLLFDDKRKTLFGATLMCKNADSLASELTLIIRLKIPLPLVASTPHVASSLSELIRLSAQKVVN